MKDVISVDRILEEHGMDKGYKPEYGDLVKILRIIKGVK